MSQRYANAGKDSQQYFSLNQIAIFKMTNPTGEILEFPAVIEKVTIQPDSLPVFDLGFRSTWRTGERGGALTLCEVPAWRYLVDRDPTPKELEDIANGFEDITRLFYLNENGEPVRPFKTEVDVTITVEA